MPRRAQSTHRIALIGALALVLPLLAADGPQDTSVATILAEHDRALVRDLAKYVREHDQASDLEQAYQALFQRLIDNDWFTEYEPLARRYLDTSPTGAARPLAQIVATMARAESGDHAQALITFRSLLQGLNDPAQEEFAVNFADALAASATRAGAYAVTRGAYEALLKQFSASPTLRQRVQAELARLDLIDKPLPDVVFKDIDGKPLRLSDLRGKFVLVDFWATWCEPCLAELPQLRAAYDQYRANGFEVIAVSLDESVKPLAEFIRDRKLPWRQVHNATCENDLVALFQIGSIPSNVLIGPDGRALRLDLRGPTLADALAALIK